MPAGEDPASGADPNSIASEPLEVLLTWPPLVRYLDACILRAAKPWSRQLEAQDFDEIRRRAYAELCLDPVLGGLLRRLARELGRYGK